MKTQSNLLSERLKFIRKYLKLSQEQFGDLIGKHQTTIQKWEARESKPPKKSLIHIAQILNIDTDALLDKKADLEKIKAKLALIKDGRGRTTEDWDGKFATVAIIKIMLKTKD